MNDSVITVLGLWSAAVFFNDYRHSLIPNHLSLGAIFVASFVLIVTGQTLTQQPMHSATTGLFVALVLTMPGYHYKLLGAGDVKLLCAIALLCGLQAMLLSFAIASVGVVLVLAIASRGAFFGKYIAMPTKPRQKFIPFGAALASALLLILVTQNIAEINHLVSG